jgi:N-acetylmuramoyl-L-alanine amidase
MGKRRVNWILIHQSASSNPAHDDISVIRKWHTERGFTGPDGISGNNDDIGYHVFIKRNGDIQRGRPEEAIGAHCRNHNAGSIGICLSGHFDKKDPKRQPTPEQFKALEILLIELCQKYDLEKSDILAHEDLAPTECPGFDLHGWLSSLSWH